MRYHNWFLGLILLLLTGCAATASLTRGEELSQAGQWDEAVRVYMEILVQEPQSVEARVGLIRALRAASETHTKRGRELEEAQRHAESAAAYTRALTFNSENREAREGAKRMGNLLRAQAHLTRGKELMAAGSLREAARELAAAQKLDPANPEIADVLEKATGELRAELEATRREKEKEQEKTASSLFPTQPVNLRFRDADIKEVLEVFGRMAGVNIFLDEGLTPRRVTISFQDLSLRGAFELLLTTNRLFAKRAGDKTVIVIPDTPAKHQQYDDLMVQTFYLNDADAKVTVNLLRTILNTRQIFVNEKLNALVVRETPEKIALAKKLLEANDRGPGEVEIQLEVLEVNRSRLENLGIQLKDESFSVTLGLPYKNIPLAAFGAFAGTETITIAPDPTLILNLAKSDADTKTLANPTIRVIDRQKARILIGERRPFQISSLTTSTTIQTTQQAQQPITTTPGTLQETRVEFRDVGLKLSLTPTIHPAGEVTVELNFEISSLGAPIPGVAGGALLPPVNTRNLDTFIKIKDGETRLLGGLIQDISTEGRRRIPLLGDIPLIGRLFSNTDTTKTRTDVLISLTPRIVKAMELPRPEVESFFSGTSEGFVPEAPVSLPAPPRPPAVAPPPPPPPRPPQR